jgi:hypothetical protein
MVLTTFRQVPVEQRYPDKVQPSPEGRNDADTGDTGAIVADSAGSGTVTNANTAPIDTPIAK